MRWRTFPCHSQRKNEGFQPFRSSEKGQNQPFISWENIPLRSWMVMGSSSKDFTGEGWNSIKNSCHEYSISLPSHIDVGDSHIPPALALAQGGLRSCWFALTAEHRSTETKWYVDTGEGLCGGESVWRGSLTVTRKNSGRCGAAVTARGSPLLPKAACPYSLAAVLSGWKVHACGYISVPAWEKLLSTGESALYAELRHTCQ